MQAATYRLPPGVSPSSPRQYVTYINDPAVASIAPSAIGASLVLNQADHSLLWESGDWKLRVSKDAIFGARICRGSHVDWEYITLVLNFPLNDGTGYGLLTGSLEMAGWFKNLAVEVHDLIPGGVKWSL
jgi:hypothetical protein